MQRYDTERTLDGAVRQTMAPAQVSLWLRERAR